MGVVERPRVTRDVPCSRMRVACGKRGLPTMERRKFIIGAGALATGSSAAVGTGAFSTMTSGNRDANVDIVADSDAVITIESGMDSEIVSENSDGELEVDFSSDNADGINPGSSYQLGYPLSNDAYSRWETGNPENGDESAFTVTNHDSRSQDITIEYDASNGNTGNTGEQIKVRTTYEGSSKEDDFAGTDDTPASVTVDNVGSGETVYVALLFRAGDTDLDFSGEITVSAEASD